VKYAGSNTNRKDHSNLTWSTYSEITLILGVVADNLHVHGVSNLCVCDASIFPQTICTHTQAPVVMVAEKCADMIKATNTKKH
jgi:hypothetical protein